MISPTYKITKILLLESKMNSRGETPRVNERLYFPMYFMTLSKLIKANFDIASFAWYNLLPSFLRSHNSFCVIAPFLFLYYIFSYSTFLFFATNSNNFLKVKSSLFKSISKRNQKIERKLENNLSSLSPWRYLSII